MSSFSSRLLSIMALSRGETCGLTPHKKKEEIEQKYSQGQSWVGAYISHISTRKKKKFPTLGTWNTFPRRVWAVIPGQQDAFEQQMRHPRQAQDYYICLCGISCWLIHWAPCWGWELLWELLWGVWTFTTGSDFHFCSQLLKVGVLVFDTESLCGLNPWCTAQ